MNEVSFGHIQRYHNGGGHTHHSHRKKPKTKARSERKIRRIDGVVVFTTT